MNKSIQQSILIFILLAYVICNCDSNCAECDNDLNRCAACNENYEFNNFGGCIPVTQNNKNCVLYDESSRQCIQCQPTYNLLQNKCNKIFTGCVKSHNKEKCVQCGFNTILAGSSCIGVINCNSFSLKCSRCAEGYELVSNKCIDVSLGCATRRDQNGLCSSCKQGYFYSGYRCFQNQYRNTRCYILKDNHNCLECKFGYQLMKGKCLLQSQLKKSSGVPQYTTKRRLLGQQSDNGYWGNTYQQGYSYPQGYPQGYQQSGYTIAGQGSLNYQGYQQQGYQQQGYAIPIVQPNYFKKDPNCRSDIEG